VGEESTERALGVRFEGGAWPEEKLSLK
jgi:hypothetical protein